jgi:hypothetical protein
MIRKVLFLLSLTAATALTGCMSVPTGLDTSLDRTTAHDKYRVTIRSLAEPIAINKIHAWEVQLRTPAGEPVFGASIDVGGGMPQHGHGLPTKPLVRRELADGTYLLEGMKFSMSGWWEIKLKISAAAGADDVTFNTVIASGAERP